MPALDGPWAYLLVALVFFLLGRATRDRGPRPTRTEVPRPASTPEPPPEVAAGLEAELQTLIAGGNLIQAVKRYRDATGTDLKTARDAVFARQEEWRRRGPA